MLKVYRIHMLWVQTSFQRLPQAGLKQIHHAASRGLMMTMTHASLVWMCWLRPVITLNNVFVAGFIHIADELHGYMLAITCLQRQVFITDKSVFLQPFQHDLVRFNILERTQLSTVLPIISLREKPNKLNRKGLASVMRRCQHPESGCDPLPLQIAGDN